MEVPELLSPVLFEWMFRFFLTIGILNNVGFDFEVMSYTDMLFTF